MQDVDDLMLLTETEALDPLDAHCPQDIPCRVHDGEMWFAETPEQVEHAKALCRGCPAVDACLSGARERREPWGVWGGQLFVKGTIVAQKRRAGRPRKYAA